MKGLISYSGIAAKVHAMRGRLLTDKQYKTMAGFESVSEAVNYLRDLPAYSDIFPDLDSEELHRGTIEHMLAGSLYRDYSKLYRFASMKQRKFFHLYFIHFEVDILKNCLRNAAAHQPVPLGLGRYEAFFQAHSDLDMMNIATASTLDELIDSLEGSAYYSLLSELRDSGEAGHFDYEMALDLYYFKITWNAIRKKLPKEERETILQGFGVKLDLLNLQWIYRTKRYYSIAGTSIEKLLIPFHYRIHSDQLERLIASESMDEFFSALNETWYGNQIRQEDLEEKPDLEILYRIVLNRLHKAAARNHPYSMAALYSYMYFKEEELRKIITVIEGVRYGIETGELISLIEHN